MRYGTSYEAWPMHGSSRAALPLSQDVLEALEQADLFAEYDARPAYQRNDYLAWIQSEKRPATRRRGWGS